MPFDRDIFITPGELYRERFALKDPIDLDDLIVFRCDAVAVECEVVDCDTIIIELNAVETAVIGVGGSAKMRGHTIIRAANGKSLNHVAGFARLAPKPVAVGA